MTVEDAISYNIRGLEHAAIGSRLQPSGCEQARFTFPIKDKSFLPYSIKENTIKECADNPEYNSINFFYSISVFVSYRTIGPVIKRCFEGSWRTLLTQIKFKDSYLYAGSGIILDDTFRPLLILGKVWERNDNTYTATNVCKINPKVFRIADPINRYIKDKIIPWLGEDPSSPWKNSFKIEIDCSIEDYVDSGVSLNNFLQEDPQSILYNFIENTFDKIEQGE